MENTALHPSKLGETMIVRPSILASVRCARIPKLGQNVAFNQYSSAPGRETMSVQNLLGRGDSGTNEISPASCYLASKTTFFPVHHHLFLNPIIKDDVCSRYFTILFTLKSDKYGSIYVIQRQYIVEQAPLKTVFVSGSSPPYACPSTNPLAKYQIR
jgi:hypothetical protein